MGGIRLRHCRRPIICKEPHAPIIVLLIQLRFRDTYCRTCRRKRTTVFHPRSCKKNNRIHHSRAQNNGTSGRDIECSATATKSRHAPFLFCTHRSSIVTDVSPPATRRRL